jgi:hypothetical protein
LRLVRQLECEGARNSAKAVRLTDKLPRRIGAPHLDGKYSHDRTRGPIFGVPTPRKPYAGSSVSQLVDFALVEDRSRTVDRGPVTAFGSPPNLRLAVGDLEMSGKIVDGVRSDPIPRGIAVLS